MAIFGEHRVTTAELTVLAVVTDNPLINQADLAQALSIERPRMVPIINNLEEGGFAVRTFDNSDSRARYLLDEGRTAASDAAICGSGRVCQSYFFSGLPEAIELSIALLK